MNNNNCKVGDILFDDYGNALGFYDGMRKLFVDNVAEYIKSGDYERAGEWCELLGDLDKYKESNALLVVTEHNGMGWTIDEYKGGENVGE